AKSKNISKFSGWRAKSLSLWERPTRDEFAGYNSLGRFRSRNITNTWAVHPSFTKICPAGRPLQQFRIFLSHYCQRTTASGNAIQTAGGDERSSFGNPICGSAIKR